MKNILITGVSSGIGEAITRNCIEKGYRVFGTLRTEEQAVSCSQKWGKNFIGIVADVRDQKSLTNAYSKVKNVIGESPLHVIINNAGVAKTGPIQLQPLEEMREMFEVNVLGTVAVIQTFLPLMQRKNAATVSPKIINISSVAGKISAPFLGAYAATKHAVEGYTNSLRRELMPWGIKVVLVAPGNVRTPIWRKAASTNLYSQSEYQTPFKNFIDFALHSEKKGMQPEEIASVIGEIIESENPKVRYAPVAQKIANWYIPRILPSTTIDKMMFKMLGMKKVHSV